MKDNMREYYEMLKRIANLLVVKDIPNEELKKILSYVDKFKLDIKKTYTEYEYILNLSNLTYLYEELLKYPDKEEMDVDTISIFDDDDDIYRSRRKLDMKETIKQKLYFEIITYMTILATLVSIPINYFKGDTNKKKVYFTNTTSYVAIDDLAKSRGASLDLVDNDSHLKNSDRLLHEYYESNNGVVTSNSDYLEILPYISNYIIKTYYPWQVSDDIATRQVITYEITDESLFDLFDLDQISYMLSKRSELDIRKIVYSEYDLANILAKCKQTRTVETKKVKEISKASLLYYEPYDEFIIYNQDLSDFMLVNNPHRVIDGLLILFEEAILYALIVTTFDNAILVTLYQKIMALSLYYKLNKKEQTKLQSLLLKYQEITKNENNNYIKKRIAN